MRGVDRVDAAMVVSDYLNSRDLGAESYLAVPAVRPATFLVVEQTGGSSDEGIGWDLYADVDCWAPTRAAAARLADAACDALLDMPAHVTNVFGVEVTSLYSNPDLESSPPHPRYTVGINITAV